MVGFFADRNRRSRSYRGNLYYIEIFLDFLAKHLVTKKPDSEAGYELIDEPIAPGHNQ